MSHIFSSRPFALTIQHNRITITMLNTAARQQVLSSRPVSRLVACRSISVSPAAPKTLSNDSNSAKRFKFTYETAKNKFVSQSNFNVPENQLDFSSYSINNVSTSASPSTSTLLSEENAKCIPSIVALHARLSLPTEFKYNTLVKALTCPTQDTSSPSVNNQQLSIYGSHILSFYVSEYLLANYPRLPISVLKAAVDAHIGNFSLFDLAKNVWGIEEDTTSKLEKYLSNEPELFRYGTLRYLRKVTTPESNVVKYESAKSPESAYELSKSEAFANSVRSIIAGIHLHTGNDEITKAFIHDHILSRQVDIASFFAFQEPGKLLTRLLKTNNLQPPTVRLISETGRLSSTPVYVVGCFSGENLLSTAEGTSLKEARIKSFNKALKAWYLYKPLDAKLPSDSDFTGMYVDQGEKFY